MPVKVSLQADPTIMVTGTLREVSPGADPVTGTYTAKVALADPPPQMRLGAIIRGRVEIPGKDPLVRLPPTALLQTGDTPAVWVVGADQTVSRQPVTVRRYDTDSVLISEGLHKGDLVVVAGVNSLAEGQKVTVDKVPGP